MSFDDKRLKAKLILIYLFPLLVIGIHLIEQRSFLKENLFFYLLGIGLLLYAQFFFINIEAKTVNFNRIVYFVYIICSCTYSRKSTINITYGKMMAEF